MYRSLCFSLIFFFFLFLFAVAVIAAPSGVTVVASTESSTDFTVSFTPDLAQLVSLQTIDSQSVLSRTVIVVVPPTGAVTLANSNGTSQVLIESSSLSPVVDGMNVPLVSVSEPFKIRGRRLVNVTICPVRGNSIYTSVSFVLRFESPIEREATPAVDPWFDNFLSKTTPNFAQARNWKESRPLTSVLSGSAALGPFSSGAAFVKMAVREGGIYRITGAMLTAAGITLGNLVTDSIRVFNGGGLQNEFLNSRPRPQFTEIAISVSDGGDGRFDATDQLLFFGEGLSRWTYSPNADPTFVSHHYAADNIYWLAIGGNFIGTPVRMAAVDGSVTGVYDFQVSQGKRYVHVEQDSTLALDITGHQLDYYEWFWSTSPSIRLFVPTPGVVPSTTSTLALSARTSFGSPNGYVTTRVNGVAATSNCNPGGCTGTTSALTSGLNRIDLGLSPLSPGYAPSYFDWIEFGYTSILEPSNDNLDVTLAVSSGRAQVVVTDQYSATPEILNLDNPLAPVRIVNSQRASGKVTYEAMLTAGGPNRFYSTTPAQFKSPVSMTRVTPTDLYVDLSPADLVIVTTPQFVSALTEYVDYRVASGHTSRIVTVGDITDNFSWGVYDPTAIRDFLKYVYENWNQPAPSAVLFIGDGNYDYLNHLSTNVPNYVPSYNMPISFDPRGGDDNYVYFGNYGILDSDTSYANDRGFDMMTARWPVKTSSEIRTITSKIKEYESGSSLASWRKNVVIVADDEYGASDNEIFHVADAITLEQSHIPRTLHRNRIYLWDYPIVNRERPAVNDAIVAAFNDGALLVDYIGHGNPDVWAHEHVLRRSSDLARMTNRNRLPLVYAASCAIGFFDDPKREAMGEDFLSMSSGGAIGIISAARLVYSSPNAILNREVFHRMLYGEGLTINESLFAAKVLRQYASPFQSANDRAYVYFGDPFLRLGMPQMNMVFDQKPDSLTPLGIQTITGQVVDESNVLVPKNGLIYVDVYDSDRPKTHRLVSNSDVAIDYVLGGPSIYHGSATVTGGRFSFQFVTPLDVNFGGTGARIEIYAVLDSSIDALGLVDSLAVRNAAAPTADSSGPVITYRIPGRSNFLSGDHVTRGEQLEIRISDPSGINLTSGLGHGITIEIDNQPDQMRNLSSTFSFEQNSYTGGSTAFSFGSLEPGEHTLKIKAWDNANNYAASSLSVTVSGSDALAIHNLLNYPNPMSGSTTFYFELSNPADRFTLEIFTLSGRKIQSMERLHLSADNYPNDVVSIGWDGRDMVGDRVATGVYIYKATAVPQLSGKPVESFGKVVLVN